MNPTKERAVADSTLHRWAEITPEQMNPLITRQYVVNTNTMLARLVLRKGAHVALHKHVHEQISHVVEGALNFSLDGEDSDSAGGRDSVHSSECSA